MIIYTCDICNKEFKSKGSLSSHRNWHRPEYAEKGKLGGKNASIINVANRKEKVKERELTALKNYSTNPSLCKKCNDIIPFKYRHRQFCSKQCSGSYSNNFITAEVRERQKITLNQTLRLKRVYNYPKLKPEKSCVICEAAHRFGGKTCSKDCFKKHVSNQVKGKTGGFRNFGGGNRGYVNGILYQSGWEKIWIEYHLQENIPFRRCTEYFEYEFEGKRRKYYPDFFLINENTYVEVKGFWSELTEAKLASIPSEFGLIVCQKQEIKEFESKLNK